MTQIDRRRFLQIALSSLVASSVGSPVLGGGREDDPAAGSAPQWYPDLESARELGRIYLEHHTNPKNLDALEKQLFEGHSEGSSNGPSRETLKQLAERVRADFSSARVVDVSGWQLAKTEIELCALLAREVR